MTNEQIKALPREEFLDLISSLPERKWSQVRESDKAIRSAVFPSEIARVKRDRQGELYFVLSYRS